MVLAVSTIPQQSLASEGFSLFENGTTAYIKFARWLKQQQETMKPKAFKALLAEYGMIRREATKFIKLAKVSDHFVPEDLAKLGLMMFSLLTPRYKELWSEMLDGRGSSTYQDEAGLNIPCDMPTVPNAKTSKPASSWRGQCDGDLTQELVDGLKKQMFPTKKRENKKQSSITSAIHNQETQARVEKIASSEGISLSGAVDKALDYYQAFAEGRLVWAEGKDLADVVAVSSVSPGAKAPCSENSSLEEEASLPILIESRSEAQVADVNESLQTAIALVNSEEAQSQDDLSMGEVADGQTPSEAIAIVGAEQDELEQFITAEEVALQQWGLSLGDTVVWADEEHDSMMAGRIYDVTVDQALVDCGLQNPVAVGYAHIKKITPESIESALSDGRSPHSQILMKARNVKALWNVNSIQAEASLNELLKIIGHKLRKRANCQGGMSKIGKIGAQAISKKELRHPLNPHE
ncbi:hypothetical protein B4U84_28525 [Westiellopsis prolifica IICB1]|nr:hypothetical protein B4U84_28525 [Westiellopsis prolifica IICB1]